MANFILKQKNMIYLIHENKIIKFQSESAIGAGYADCPRATQDEIDSFLLQEAKEAKLNELYRFHESNEVKYLTIRIGNLKTGIFVNQEYRYLIDEQRELLQIKKLKGDPNPIWNYVNGVTLPLTLDFLNNLRLYIGDLTDFNFKAKINNVKLINNLKTKDDVENFNVKNGYRFNQEFTV